MDADAAGRVIAAARSYGGTRFRHQGRTPGVGLDCAGMIVCAYRAAGIHVADTMRYSRLPDPRQLRRTIEHTHALVTEGPIEPADVLLFRIDIDPQHTALAVDSETMIHAFLGARRVTEHRIDASWRSALVAVYRLRSDLQ